MFFADDRRKCATYHETHGKTSEPQAKHKPTALAGCTSIGPICTIIVPFSFICWCFVWPPNGLAAQPDFP